MNPTPSRLALILSLVLALGSVIMAPARVQAAGQGQMVICAGAGTAILTLDAQGNPVGPVHLCPDCLTGFAVAGLPVTPGLAPRDAGRRLPGGLVQGDVGGAGRPAPVPAARGPPI